MKVRSLETSPRLACEFGAPAIWHEPPVEKGGSRPYRFAISIAAPSLVPIYDCLCKTSCRAYIYIYIYIITHNKNHEVDRIWDFPFDFPIFSWGSIEIIYLFYPGKHCGPGSGRYAAQIQSLRCYAERPLGQWDNNYRVEDPEPPMMVPKVLPVNPINSNWNEV